MKPENKTVAVAVAISLALTVGYNLLLPAKVKEVVNTIVEKTVGSAGNEYGENVKFLDGATFATQGTGGGVLRGDGMIFPSGTTTVCNLISPSNATSSLVAFKIASSKNATTTAREISLASSTVDFATTSAILDGSTMVVTGGQEFSLSLGSGSTTAGGIKSRFEVLAPSTRIVVSLKGGNHTAGVGTTTELEGSCSALFLTEGK